MKTSVLPFSRAFRVLACFAAMCCLSCATTQQTRSAKPSGFLKNYSQLREGEGKEAQLIYINSKADFSNYRAVMIDPVTIWGASDAKMSRVPKKELQQLADLLYGTLKTELAKDYTIVERPGRGVLRLRVAITEAKGSKIVLDIVSTAVPQLRVIAILGKLASDTHAVVGQAAVEGEIIDSLSGERLLAAVDERAGTKVFKGSTSTWSDVEEAYKYWAERLRLRLNGLRSRGVELSGG